MRFACAVLVAIVVAACGGGPTATASPSPGPTTSPSAAPVYGVFVTDFGAGQNGYKIDLVGADGKVAVSANGRNRAFSGGVSDLPVVSITRDRVYYLDGDSDVRYMNNSTAPGGLAYHIPVKAQQVATFAVSTDDQHIAYTVLDYSTTPPSMHLFSDDLGGGKLNDLFSSTSVYEWPVGWHLGNIVLAVSATANTQMPGGWFIGSSGFQIVDSATAGAVASICTDPGASTPFPTSQWGTACTVGSDFSVVSWDGDKKPVLAQDPCPSTGPPSPDGTLVAVLGSQRVCKGTANDPVRVFSFASGVRTLTALGTPLGWLDSSHLLVQADPGSGVPLSPSASPIEIVSVSSASSTQVLVAGIYVGAVPAASS